jgi:ABC-type multidrug transport system permease subunit
VILLWLFRRLRDHRRCRRGETPVPDRAGTRRHGTLHLVLHQARFDLLAFFRNRQSRFFTLAIMLPLYFISGVFIPNVNLPAWLQDIAKVFPVQHLSDGLHHAFDPATRGTGIVWSDLGILALWAAGGLTVALLRFTWTPAAATG